MTIKRSFIIHTDSLSVLKKLKDEQAGKLFKAIAVFQEDGLLPEDEFISIVFEPFLNQFSRDLEKYQNIVDRNKLNGSKGGRPKNPVGYLETQSNPEEAKKADSGIDSGNGIDSESGSKIRNVDEECKLKSKSESKRFIAPTLEEITIPNFIDASLWNSFLEMRVSKKAKPTQKAIELIIKELTKFHNKGLNANESLENSIKSNWTGVFEPRNNNQSQFLTTDQKRRQNNLNASAEFLRLTSGDDNAGQ